MKHSSFKVLAGAAVCAAALAFGSCGGAGNTVTIDYQENVAQAATDNYFSWTTPKATVPKDTFDAATSASKFKSTTRFDLLVTFDTPQNAPKYTGYALPASLRGLLLFPVAPDSVRAADNLTVTANGKALVIRYVHRDTAYEIKTDAEGNIDPLTSCFAVRGIAKPNADDPEAATAFAIQPEWTTSGQVSENGADFDWAKGEPALKPDKYSDNATRHYEGKLAATFTNNVLAIKGTLNEVKAK
jgi:hypothetical protein